MHVFVDYQDWIEARKAGFPLGYRIKGQVWSPLDGSRYPRGGRVVISCGSQEGIGILIDHEPVTGPESYDDPRACKLTHAIAEIVGSDCQAEWIR